MKDLIESAETSNAVDVEEHVAALQQHRPDAPVKQTPATVSDVAAVVATPPATVSNAPSEAVREFLIECYENLEQMDHDLLALEQNASSTPLLRGIFRTMHTIKGGAGFLGLGKLEGLAHAAENLLGKLRDGTLAINPAIITALLATVNGCRDGLGLLESHGNDAGFQPEVLIAQLGQAECATSVSSASPEQATVAKPEAVKLSETLPTPAPEQVEKLSSPAGDASNADKNNSAAGESTIRVDVALLDKLMTRVGELVLARNQILQFTTGLEDAAFVSTAQRLNLITAELQESVMKTRMQPIGNVWAKFPRVVRDLSSQLGKQVNIEMEGKETELDKTIVEAIKDPLTHLVRNSVDHGIESPESRRAAGKPSEGTLLLRAYHEGGQVNIEITDDGAGLNLERIRRKAVERGLLSADQATRMSDRDAAQLIFAPGFSTAEKVTSVSGRGVGMDVVKTNIEKIGGTIDLQSTLGRGTTIKIKIPLTLAIIPALIVTDQGDRYAISQVSLLELVRLEGQKALQSIEYIHGAPVYRLRGKLLPLVYLSHQLRTSSAANSTGTRTEGEAVNIVVLRTNDRQFGLVVDKINDTAEIVVKPLSRQLKGLSEYAGSTIMGDGAVALILDVMGLAIAAGLAAEHRESPGTSTAGHGTAGSAMQTLLVVDLGDKRRFALPTSMVSRLEKIDSRTIEQTDGREVVQYRGRILPLIRLSDVFGGSSMTDSAELSVVVYADDQESCGFVVGRIVDVVETEIAAAKELDDGNLLGTAVIQQRVTDIVNLPQLARQRCRVTLPTTTFTSRSGT